MASTSQAQPQRPFACPECSNCYTRQEHLDRHIGAKHRGAKDFLCSICGKGFGRRDILKRHETAHNKPDGKVKAKAKAAPSARADPPREGRKRELPSQTSEVPAKIVRIARACNRCSKSKLRCDGEAPCSRCRTSGLECDFDRAVGWSQPPPSLPVSRAPSAASSDDGSNSQTGDSGDDDKSQTINNGHDKRLGFWTSGSPHDAVWNHPTGLPGSPYALPPPRPPAAAAPYHHSQGSSFPPATFHHAGNGLPGPSQFSPLRSPFDNLAGYHRTGGLLNPAQDAPFVEFPSPVGAAPSTSSSDQANLPPWHWDVLGRPSNPSLASADFLDLVASQETEIDWDLINTGWTEHGSAEHSALNSSLLVAGTIPTPLGAGPELHLDSSRLSDNHFLDILRPRSSSDLAAVSLLQLKSHTPRESPEVEIDPRLESRRSSLLHSSMSESWFPRPQGHEPAIAKTSMSDSETLVPDLVPHVSDLTHSQLLTDIRELITEPPQHLSWDRFVPELYVLDAFIQLYFHRFQTLVPILHPATFDPNLCPSYLLLSIAAIGSRYAYDFTKNSAMYAQTLSNLSYLLLKHQGDMDPSLSRSLPFCQAQVLDLQAGLISGAKRDLERSLACSGVSVGACKRQGWLLERPVDEALEASFSLEDRWRRWKAREEVKRLGFSTIVLDGMGTVMWDLESTTLWILGARTPLPCSDQLWEATSPEAWQALFPDLILPPKSPELTMIMNDMSDRSQHSSARLLATAKDLFAMSVVTTALHCIITLKNREMRATSLFLPIATDPNPKANPVQIAIDTCLEFCFDHVLLPAESHAIVEESSVAQNSIAVMMHLMSMSALLPLRTLQDLTLAGTSEPWPDMIESVKIWARRDGGHAARRTIWHAGQLLALVRLTETDTPLEPFALFYAALVLIVFVDHSDRHHATVLPTPGHDLEGELALDKLVDRTDPALAQWLVTGDGTVSLTGIGALESEVDSEVVREKLLRVIGARLINLQAWKVGELLGRTLHLLADERGRKTSVRVKKEEP